MNEADKLLDELIKWKTKALIQETVNDSLQRDNEQLRKGLGFYADEESYEGTNFWNIVIDSGRTARKHLGRKTNDVSRS